jgi:hypothetical protein
MGAITFLNLKILHFNNSTVTDFHYHIKVVYHKKVISSSPSLSPE